MSTDETYSMNGVFGDFGYSGPAVSRGLLISMALCADVFWKITGGMKILVVGAGHGYEVVNLIKNGHNVQAVDLFVPEVEMVKEVTTQCSADKMPFEDDEFDLVFCTEMLEHVPEDLSLEILVECKRVARRFLFSIATRGDAPYNTHINVHPGWWWIRAFEELEFKLHSASCSARLYVPFSPHIAKVAWGDGVLLYGDC